MRIGTNNRPYYRVVAVDERKKRTGGYLELLGTYNPLTEPKEINLDQGKIDAWIKKGAQPSEGFLRIIGKAPQRPPRKPKKAPKEQPATVSSQPSATEPKESKEPEVKAEEAAVSETGQPTTEQPESESGEPKTENNEAPVVSEKSIAEAPAAEPAQEAAQVLEAKTEEAENSDS